MVRIAITVEGCRVAEDVYDTALILTNVYHLYFRRVFAHC
jgi:hypothetical protein